jgi:sugar fermentation stimulation protein A
MKACAPSLLKIPNPVECRIIKRLNRFVVEVEVDGIPRRAHTTNTGRLEQFLIPGKRSYCVPNREPAKTDFLLFAIRDGRSAALIDTRLQMRAFERAVGMQVTPWLADCRIVRANARLGASLIDYQLRCGERVAYLEVKSAVFRDGDYAMYPDCPTLRGQKHTWELTSYIQHGGRAIILFIAALPRVTAFKPFRAGDPALYELLVRARDTGVELRAIQMVYEPARREIVLLNDDLPVEV